MNILNRIGNIFGGKPQGHATGNTAAQTLKAVERGESAMPTPIPSRTVAPQAEPDPFIAKFTAPPFFENPVWRFGRWVANPVKIPIAMAEWFLYEMDQRGHGLGESEKKELVEIAVKWNLLEEKINETGFFASTQLLQKQREAVRAELDAGESIAPGRIQSRDEFYQQSLTTRAEARAIQTQLSRRVFSIMNQFCERVSKLAKELVIAEEKAERRSSIFGFEYRASEKIKAMIYLAVAGYTAPVSNFMPEWPSLRPDPEWFGAKLFDLPKDEKAIEAARQKLADEQALKNSGRERQRQRDQAKAELSKAEHEAAVIELNNKNDAIRAELETESARMRNEKSEAVGAAI